MRRTVLTMLVLAAALAVPAAAGAAKTSPNDGVLVVKNASAPKGVPVVELTITGSVIGQTNDQSTIIIDTGPTGPHPDVTSAVSVPVKTRDATPTAQAWMSPDGFKFRVVGATKAVIVIYGSQVNLVAVGTGSVVLAGTPDLLTGDGRYSINGNPFLSMPGQPIKQLILGDGSTG